MLRDKLKPAIRTKRRWQLSKGVALLHDNACPYTAAHTVETLRHLNFEVLKHPPYSPDWPLRTTTCLVHSKTLRGRHFANDQELKEVVHAWLVTQPKTFFSDRIQKLVSRWTKCVTKEGEYVEKWCSCNFCIVVVLILKIYCRYFLTRSLIFKIMNVMCMCSVPATDLSTPLTDPPCHFIVYFASQTSWNQEYKEPF
jgi:hypothetical protein